MPAAISREIHDHIAVDHLISEFVLAQGSKISLALESRPIVKIYLGYNGLRVKIALTLASYWHAVVLVKMT